MFAIAFLIGVYANLLFLLGVVGLYQKPIIIIVSIVYVVSSIVFWRFFDEKIAFRKGVNQAIGLFHRFPVWVMLIFISVLLILFGVLGPELAFDALWYHLTLPKIFLAQHSISYIPGGLLYYSTMPKLGEILYGAGLSFGNEILAKYIHATFAFLVGICIYCITKKYTSPKYALIAVVIFLSNIVVLWEATTAYVDLVRAFFEIMALWGALEYLSSQKRKWLIESAILLGLAIETKLIAVGSVLIFIGIIFIFQKKEYSKRLKDMFLFVLLVLLPSLGWFVMSYLSTGNPFYPLFTLYSVHLGQDTLAFPGILIDPITIFIKSADPISPVYLIVLPLFFFIRKDLPKNVLSIFFYCLGAIVVWSLTPRTGGGRFLVPYLPGLSIGCAVLLFYCKNTKIVAFSLKVIVVCMLIALLYRGIATLKFIPVILGLETKNEFLLHHLNFSFGDFMDEDGQLANLVRPGSTTLLYGFHNLYYMDIPFIDSSWVQKGDRFEYIATQHAQLPLRFRYWQPIYTNMRTGVTLYTLHTPWMY